MVGVIAYTEFLYYLNIINCLVFSCVFVNVFVLFPSFAPAYFIIGLGVVEQERK